LLLAQGFGLIALDRWIWMGWNVVRRNIYRWIRRQVICRNFGRPSRFLLEPLPAAPALLTSMDGGNAEDCREQFRPPSMAVGRIGSLGNCSCVALPPASLAVVPIATLPPSMAVVKPGRSNRQRSGQAGPIDKDDRQCRIRKKPKADMFSCLSCLSWTLRNISY
jgi:hypothetical protein